MDARKVPDLVGINFKALGHFSNKKVKKYLNNPVLISFKTGLPCVL